jgi:hypothetical protein
VNNAATGKGARLRLKYIRARETVSDLAFCHKNISLPSALKRGRATGVVLVLRLREGARSFSLHVRARKRVNTYARDHAFLRNHH